jgi:oligoendopeptidase F
MKWDLSIFYKDSKDPKLATDLLQVQKDAKKTGEKYKSLLMEGNYTPKDVLQLFTGMEEIYTMIGKIGSFCHLNQATDNLNQEYQKLMSKINEASVAIHTEFVFLPEFVKNLDDKTFLVLTTNPQLKNYRHLLEHIRKEKEHILAGAEETIIENKNVGGKSAFKKLYRELTSSMRFKMKLKGKFKTMNASEILALRENPDPAIRKLRTKVFFREYEKNQLVIENIYNAILKDHQMECKLRNYDDPSGPKNMTNELSREIVDVLSDITTKNADIVSEYYQIKTKLLGGQKLSLSDIYAPIGSSKKKYDWIEAKEIVLSAYQKFDPDASKKITEFFAKNWIDSELAPNKTGGAFCASFSPQYHPFVLVNFTGTQRDVETLAHELGHGLHALLSNQQTLLNYFPIMPMAEIASVFGEMLVTDDLLSTMTDKNEKIAFLCSKIESAIATTFRQNMFHRFEMKTHMQIKDSYLTITDLRKIYREELLAMFGSSVSVPKEYEMEWAYVSHIFQTPFYVYAYNFAQLVVFALYQKYKQEKKGFKELLYSILEAGSSDTPQNILSKAGINLTDPMFWENGFNFLRKEWLEQLKKLI